MNFFIFAFVFVMYYYVTDSTRAARPNRLGLYQNTLQKSSSRIIGGSFAEKDQFPYQASIRYFDRYFKHICGGTLIHPQYVLTAGHCYVGNGSYEVAVGLLYRLDNNGGDVQVKQIADFIVHPQYPGGVAKYDIAVIRLQEPVSLNKGVSIARLPTNEEECDIIEFLTISGWGLTQNIIPIAPIALRYEVLPRISNEQCMKFLIENYNYLGPFDESMLCTVANEGNKQSACSGDSGGPSVDSSTNTLIGVVSFGVTPCGKNEKAPTIYTNVCKYRGWIEGIIN